MNGKSYLKNSIVPLTGGDEVVFSLSGKHAYVSFFPTLPVQPRAKEICYLYDFAFSDRPCLVTIFSFRLECFVYITVLNNLLWLLCLLPLI